MKKLILLALAAAVLPTAVLAESEEGAAKDTPWSGYWWPIAKGEMIQGPLAKYDQITGSSAAQWEYANNPPGANVPQWHGYCHAWSASALSDKEPNQQSSSNNVQLSIGDQKGMLASCHTQDVPNTYGDRYGDGNGSEDMNDMAPDLLWNVLKTYIGQQGTAIVMDLEAGDEVWNYPVYAYRVDYWPQGGDQYVGQMGLWAADDDVEPDYVGTKVHYQTYQFSFQMRGGQIVMGSGRWIGNSVRVHPDFAWYPYVAVASNPNVDYEKVKGMVASTDVPPETNDPTKPPVDPNQPPIVDPTGVIPGGGLPPGGGTIGGGQMPGGFGPGGGLWTSPLQLAAAVAERTSAFSFDITVDRFDGGRYAFGDPVRFTGNSAQDGFLYMFLVTEQGALTLLFPAPGQNNFVRGGVRFSLPSPQLPREFVAGQPIGVHRVKAIVTRQPLYMTGLQGPVQMQQQKGLFNRQPYRPFKWYPSQQQQMQQMLVSYQTTKTNPVVESYGLAGISNPEAQRMMNPLAALGPFAQDEVAFYVGPPGSR